MPYEPMQSIAAPRPDPRALVFEQSRSPVRTVFVTLHAVLLCACAPLSPPTVRLGTPALETRPDCTASRPAVPRMPRDAAKAGIEGWTLVSFDIASDGTPSNVRVTNSRPEGVFDQASLEAVKGSRFTAGSPRINCQTTFTFSVD